MKRFLASLGFLFRLSGGTLLGRMVSRDPHPGLSQEMPVLLR